MTDLKTNSRFTAIILRAWGSSPSTRMAVLALSIVVAATLLVTVLVSRHERDIYLADSGVRLAARAGLEGDLLIQEIAALRRDVLFLANTPPVQGILRASRNRGFDAQENNSTDTWPKRLDQIFSAFTTANPRYFLIRLIGVADQGRELVRVDMKDGRVVATASAQMQQKGGRDYFQATRKLKAGEVYLSEVSLNQEWGRVQAPHMRTLLAATPVFAPDGELFGMLVINLDVGPTLDRIMARAPKGIQAYLLNDQGDYLIHPDAGRTFGFDLGRRFRWQADFPGIPLFQAVDLTASGQGLLTAPSAAGLQHLSLTRIGFDPRQPQRSLILAYALPDTQVDAATAPIRNLAIAGGLALGLILSALFLLYLRRVLLPLRALTAVADQIGAGCYDAPLPETRGGEPAILVTAFHTMMERVGAREQEISRINAQLTHSAEFANHIIDSTPGAMLVVDALGQIIRANTPNEQTFGYAQQELLGKPVEILIPMPLRAHHKAMRLGYMDSQGYVDKFIRKEMGKGRELFGLHKDGHEIPLEIALSYINFGEERHVIAAITDITQRKQAETELRESEERFDLAMRASNDGLWDWDLTTKTAYYSPRWKSMLGYREDELESEFSVWGRLLDAEGKAAAMALMDDCLAGRRDGFEVIIRMRHKDGHWVDVLSRNLLVRDATGKPVRMVGTLVDMSDRMAAQALTERDREQQTTLRELLEMSMAGNSLEETLRQCLDKLLAVSWLTLQPRGGIFLMDAAAQSLHLVVAHNLPPEIASLCANVALDHCHCGQAAASGQMQYAQYLDERHGIGYPGMQDHGHYAAPLLSDNQVLGVLMLYLPTDFVRTPFTDQFIASVADILAGAISRKQAEQALVEHQANLEQMVVTRTAELDRARLEAERLSKVKDTFLATMSHEIRTPMNALLGMLELLALGRLDNDQTRMLSVAQQSGKSLLRIIDDILDFSKIEAGKLVIHPEPAAIADLIELTASFFMPIASSKGLRLSHSVSPDISPAVLADRLRLRQILNNFVSNAIKFTDQGQVEIKAELVAHHPGLDRVRISVSDTGVGIAPEHQAKLFQPFSQADAETTRRYGGTGLGLAICQRLSDMMQGSIELHSVLGQSTTLSLTLDLPVIDAELLRAAQATARVPALPFNLRAALPVMQARAAGALVLLVDDHVTNREVLTEQLRLLGYASEQADSSGKALQKWESGAYGLLITDCHMPDMDGYQLAREIRRQEAETGRKRMPILAWTANALRDARDACAAAGMDDILVKPTDLRRLEEKLHRMLPLPSLQGNADMPTAATPGTLEGILDRAILRELSGGDAAMEARILARFRTANQLDAEALARALAEQDVAAVTHLAHRIKGAARMIGASELACACEALEQAGRNGDWAGIATAQAGFLTALAQLERALHA